MANTYLNVTELYDKNQIVFLINWLLLLEIIIIKNMPTDIIRVVTH